MPKFSKDQTRYKSSTQNAMATGAAHTNPRAKLRRGPADRPGAMVGATGVVSSILSALCIVADDLLLLVRLRQRSVSFLYNAPRKYEPSRTVAGGLYAFGSRLREDCVSFALILRLAIGNAPDRHEKIQNVICLGSGSKPRAPSKLVSKFALLVVCLLAPRAVFAQPVEKEVQTPVDLFLPENSPGVRIAPTLILKTGVDAAIAYDSNIYNEQANTRSDTVAIVSPSLRLGSDWSRHSAALEGTAEIRRYFKTSDENSEQWDVKGLASLDLAERMKFEGEAEIARRIEQRGTAGDTFNTDRPVRQLQKRAAIQLARTGAILEVIIGGSINKLTFDDATLNGAPIALGYRDVLLRQAHIRANFRVSPKIGVFADLSGNQVDYDQDIGIPRNSSGFGALFGLRYRISALVNAEAAFGYIRQNFDDPLVRPTNGLNYALAVNWTPTPRWKVAANGHRSVDPSPLANVSAIIRSDFNLKVQRAISDRVLFEAGAGFINEEYRGFARTDKRYFGEVSVLYRFSDHILASVHGGYRQQDSNFPGKSYDGFSAGVTVSAKL